VSARTRASLALQATTKLQAEAVLLLVKQATERVKGGGTSLLTSGLQNAGAQVHVEQEGPSRLALSIKSGKRIFELCTFAATVTNANGLSVLRVGGLDRYKTTQSRVLGFIPVGPKSIAGLDPYKRFLDEIASALRQRDPAAKVDIAEAGA